MPYRSIRKVIALGAVALLAACGAADGPRLEGERQPLRPEAEMQAVNQALPRALPAPVTNADWTHRGANPQHLIPHTTLSPSFARVWTNDIGRAILNAPLLDLRLVVLP